MESDKEQRPTASETYPRRRKTISGFTRLSGRLRFQIGQPPQSRSRHRRRPTSLLGVASCLAPGERTTLGVCCTKTSG